MPLAPAVLRFAALAVIAGAAAAAVVLWPSERRDAPAPLSVGEGAPRPRTDGEGPKPVVPGERVLPPKEGFATMDEAVLLASALDKIDLGIGPPLPPGPPDSRHAPLEWDRIHAAMLSQPGVYIRWQSEALRADVMKTSFRHLLAEFPQGAPKDGLLPWGPLFAELMHLGFKLRVENPVIWIGRKE